MPREDINTLGTPDVSSRGFPPGRGFNPSRPACVPRHRGLISGTSRAVPQGQGSPAQDFNPGYRRWGGFQPGSYRRGGFDPGFMDGAGSNRDLTGGGGSNPGLRDAAGSNAGLRGAS